MQSAGAAIVPFTESTNPVGIFSSSANLETSTVVSTRAATLVSGTNTFTHWTLNGVRKSDASGRSLNPAIFTLLEPTAAVANYLPTTQDSDADGLPDSYEIEFFGSLMRTPASDNDADGFSIQDERVRGMSPAVSNTMAEGGLSRRRSEKLLMVAPSQFTLTETSNPAGIVNSTRTVFAGTDASLSIAPESSNTLRFTGWYLGSSRIDSPLALQPAHITVISNMNVVAQYLDLTVDSDTDGIADWYEQFQFGNLTNSANSDTDGDGFTLGQEVRRGQNPQVTNTLVEGGISRRRGSRITVSPLDYVNCTLASIPQGLVSQSITAIAGSIISTQNLSMTDIGGLRFVGWEIQGTRQLDPSGAAVGIARFNAMEGAVATARFISPTLDSDVDGILDWYEWLYFGNLESTLTADPDGDGFTIGRESLGGYSPLITDQLSEGGISRRRSVGSTTVNLQPFERLSSIRINGTLTPWFSENPSTTSPSGHDFGNFTSPTWCDWDGDGDLDLFVASETGCAVFENIGSRFSMNLTERTASFDGLVSLCNGMSLPRLGAGDWNLDGHQDLVLSDGQGNLHLIPSNHSFSGEGNGAASSIFSPPNGGVFPAVGDLDGDGNADLLLADSNGTIACFFHTGNPTTPYDLPSSGGMAGVSVEGISSLSIGDFTLDGRNDVLAADAQGRIWEFHSQPDGSFLLSSKVWGGSGVGFADFPAIAASDLDGDGDIDLIGGTSNGGLFGLRDPKVGRPTGLVAASGAESVLLEWNPDWQSRIKGYRIYRSFAPEVTKEQINQHTVDVSRYSDQDLQLAATHYYQVTALTQAIYAGNSVPTLLESPPSTTVSAQVRRVTVDLQDTSGYPSSTVRVFLSVGNSIGLSGQGLEFRIQYPAGLTPLSQVNPTETTVEASGLGSELTFTSNETTANGELIIQGIGGTLDSGKGKLFTLNFQVAQNAEIGSTLPLVFISALARDSTGTSVSTTLSGAGVQIVDRGENDMPPEGGIEAALFGKGDINGDGWVNENDLDSLKALLHPSAEEPTPIQLSAGDTNGDGDLSHRDLIGILRISKGLEP